MIYEQKSKNFSNMWSILHNGRAWLLNKYSLRLLDKGTRIEELQDYQKPSATKSSKSENGRKCSTCTQTEAHKRIRKHISFNTILFICRLSKFTISINPNFTYTYWTSFFHHPRINSLMKSLPIKQYGKVICWWHKPWHPD